MSGGPTHAALLRGINVGRAKRVAMADLRGVVEGLGCGAVRTLLNSGNVAFRMPAGARAGRAPVTAQRLEEAIEERLGVSSRVVVLSRPELARILEEVPAKAAKLDPSRVLVGVPARAADVKRLAALQRRDWAPEWLSLGTRAAYMGVPEGVADSELVRAVGRELDDAVTSRNLATVTKLLALLPEED